MLEEQIAQVQADALGRIHSASAPDVLESVRVEVLGRKGVLAGFGKELPKLAPAEKAAVGKALNVAKQALEQAFETRKQQFDSEALARKLDSEWVDLTLPAPGLKPGSLHPNTIVQREIEELFTSMGFTVADGPEVETEWHNFDALNIPSDHPARDAQDTFWLESGHVLRTHTSPVQIRAMKKFGAPLRVLAPGRVFRNEEVDASHEHTFYQVEGMMIDREVSIAHLIYFMKTMLSGVFHRDVNIRLRPGYFPFVEPGFELDLQCLLCGGTGCSVCKGSGWVEQLGCGLIHPHVLRAGGIDPDQWMGFAFGLGLTRLVMMRYAIDDIRLLQSGDLRFAQQF